MGTKKKSFANLMDTTRPKDEDDDAVK